MNKGITIQINIIGQPAEGKTTLAVAFRDFLQEKGFTNVAVKDVDLALGCAPFDHDACMDAIRERPVSIETVQIRKSEV